MLEATEPTTDRGIRKRFARTAFLDPLEILQRADEVVAPRPNGTLPERVLIRLVDSLNREASLSDLGVIGAESELVHAVASQRAIAHLMAGPDPPAANLGRPVVIGGLPRSGTTLLHQLLAEAAPDLLRAPRAWEVAYPTASAVHCSVQAIGPSDARAAAAARMELLDAVAPKIGQMHPMPMDGPDECTGLIATSLMSLQTLIMFRVPSYGSWLFEQELSESYESWRAQLSVIADRNERRRWLLKSPLHVFAYDALLATVPTASLLHLRRSCVEFLESFLNLTEAARSVFSASVDPLELGKEWLTAWTMILGRASQVVRSCPQFMPIEYVELTSDPVGTVSRLLRVIDQDERHVDAELLLESFARCRRAHGPYNRQPLEYYGLTPADVRTAFKPFVDAGLMSI